jgi:peptide/nickel transport system permease protein
VARSGVARGLWGFGRRRPLGFVSGAVIALTTLAAALAGLVAPHNPYQVDYARQFSPPTIGNLLGTDEFGRDILSRILHGARFALLLGVGSAFLGTTLGGLVGVVGAYLGGRTDLLLQRLMDAVLAVPILMLAVVIVATLGNTLANLIVAIALPMVPRAARVVRASTLSLRATPFVEAARMSGASDLRIIFLHIVPNVMAPYLIVLSAVVGQAILIDAALGFLGLGISEPTPSWGVMLSGSAALYATRAPWMVIFPGAAITLAVFAFNLLGDSLRDELDPRLRLG